VETGEELFHLAGHSGEIVSMNFNSDGDKIITGSFDGTARIWDVATGECIHTLLGHQGELSCASFDFTGEYAVTGSIDR
jgi:dynein assembly factor with WDR repeat domains 1